MPTERLLLLGLDHADYGSAHVSSQAGGRTAAAISVGGDFVRMRKGDLPVPNEDACVAIDDGDRTLLVVADGHRGHWASHGLAEALQEASVPSDQLALLALLQGIAQDVPADAEGLPEDLFVARSTLLAAVVDRARHRVFGVAFGDSSLFLVTGVRPPERIARKADDYVSPWDPPSLDPRRGREFADDCAPGDLVVACTDGIDECHYQRPASSVGPEQLWSLRLEAGDAPAAYAEALAALALRGVAGNPGGQDNLAVVVTRS